MALDGASDEVGRLENAKKKRTIRISAKIIYWPLRDIVELAMWCLHT